MKIAWLSVAPWLNTGYGTQTAVFAPRVKAAGHEVMISATHGLQGTAVEWAAENGETLQVYPGDHTTLNKRMLRYHIHEHYGDSKDVQVISLWDIWPWIDPAFGNMIADFQGLNIAAWLPVDSIPVTPKTMVALERFQVRPIAMSRFGEQQLRDANQDPMYAPHGIETNIYRPSETRKARELLKVPEDAFLVGMVAHNAGLTPARKNFPGVLQAFSIFRKTHPDAYLYLHTEISGVAYQGLNLMGLTEMMGVPEDSFRCVNQDIYHRGNISNAEMAEIYSAMDVLVNPSYSEGFGLPILEAQACGTPVIVSHFSSMIELCGAGWKVGGQPFYNEAAGAMWFHPATDEIVAALEAAYQARHDQKLREKAREFALQYDADKVMHDHWLPVLDQLDKPREVPPLPSLNREQRRKLAKAAA